MTIHIDHLIHWKFDIDSVIVIFSVSLSFLWYDSKTTSRRKRLHENELSARHLKPWLWKFPGIPITFFCMRLCFRASANMQVGCTVIKLISVLFDKNVNFIRMFCGLPKVWSVFFSFPLYWSFQVIWKSWPLLTSRDIWIAKGGLRKFSQLIMQATSEKSIT